MAVERDLSIMVQIIMPLPLQISQQFSPTPHMSYSQFMDGRAIFRVDRILYRDYIMTLLNSLYKIHVPLAFGHLRGPPVQWSRRWPRPRRLTRQLVRGSRAEVAVPGKPSSP